MEQKRLFVGNLPLNVNEDEVKKKFSKYGNIVSTEIKHRFSSENEVISTFAFVTLEANRNNFEACMQHLSSTTWKGHNLKLEFAKESFLSKLKRERDENLGNKLGIQNQSLELKENQDVEKKNTKLWTHKRDVHTDSNSYHSDSSSDNVKRALPMFEGTKSYLLQEENNFKKSKTHSVNLNNQASMTMKRFEEFSEVWRDDFDMQYLKSRTPVELGNESSEPLLAHEKIKRPKQKDKEDTPNQNIEETVYSMKWFPKSTMKRIVNYTQNSVDNFNESSEDDYKSFKNKVNHKEDASNNYLDKEQNFNTSTKFQNQSNTDESKFVQKNIVSDGNIYSPRKRKESYNFSPTINSEDFESIKHEHKNFSPDMLKNDFDKLAEEKRKKALEEKRQLISQQKTAVKLALAGVDKKGQLNKKIIFSDNEEASNEEKNNENIKIFRSNDKVNHKKSLFDEESDNDEAIFKVNQQFEGVKGQKLLELQSRYAHDQRFALDSRFHESDDDNVVSGITQPQNEKDKQMEILEQVIGYQVRKPANTKKNSSKLLNTNTMLRFDPTRLKHTQFITQQTQPEEKVDTKEKKRKKKSKDELYERKQEETVKVSKETFYKVNDRLKDSLVTKDDSKFSLRKLFNSKEKDESDHEETEENVEEPTTLPIKRLRQSNPFRYDSSDTEGEDEEDNSIQINKPVAKPILLQPFFFQINDPRFEELKEFFGHHEKVSEEEFNKKRKDLKRLIHHRQMNKKQKNRPFKNKLGGARKGIGKKSSFMSRPWNQRRSKPKSRIYK